MSFPQRPAGKGSVPSILLPLDSALPTTTTVQRSLLGGSDTSNLSPTSFEMKLQKRKSDDDMNGGTRCKKNKTENLTPQVLCDEAKPELDSGKDNLDVAVSFSSAMADYQKRLQPLLSGNSPGYNGFSDDSSGPSSPAIADVDKISVDSQDVGVDGSTLAELLKQLKAHDYETGTSASCGANSKTDVLEEGDVASLDGDASTRDERKGEKTFETYRMVNEVDGSDLGTRIPGALTRVSSAVYSRLSLNILDKLWGARLCAGRKDKAVQDALENVHGQIPDKHHELLCRGAWQFQANQMILLSPPWEEFYRFAFKQKPGNEERRVFTEMAIEWRTGSDGKKTAEGITTDWQHMFFEIGESLKLQLQKMDYDLCPCHISQPHSMTALHKTLQFLHDAEENDAEKNNAEERLQDEVERA